MHLKPNNITHRYTINNIFNIIVEEKHVASLFSAYKPKTFKRIIRINKTGIN
ncbi:Unknown protein sequence [Pseudomonas syringae pv. maculicola]|nr:Unknown protein sequence [Pseudomonas syringae pv. maculicola]